MEITKNQLPINAPAMPRASATTIRMGADRFFARDVINAEA